MEDGIEIKELVFSEPNEIVVREKIKITLPYWGLIMS